MLQQSSSKFLSNVPPVRNVGHCGASWVIAPVTALEHCRNSTRNDNTVLSVQHVLNCAPGNQCDGGDVPYALNFMKTNFIATESAYPYTAESGTCAPPSQRSGAKVNQWEPVRPIYSVDAIKAEIDSGRAVITSVATDPFVFQLYSGGILNSAHCGTSLDNALVIVGYGYDSSTRLNYWTLQHSWGYMVGARMVASAWP